MERWAGIAAIVSGLAWAIALPLVATAASDDPVGLGYDDYNRVLTLPLVLLVLTLAGLRRLQKGRLSLWGRRGAAAAVIGAGLLVLGNVIEFWAVLFSDDAVFAIANDRGLDEWPGSTIGWLTFLVGSFLLFAGGVVFGVASRAAGILPGWAGLVIAATAPLLLAAFATWSSSFFFTVGFAALLGLGWVALGGLLLAAIPVQKHEERPRGPLLGQSEPKG
jgi:hypothetical protein